MTQKRFSYFFLTILNGLLFLMEQEVGANPTEPTVTAGSASCHSTPQKLEVTAHDRTIISWKDFSIASQETTRFNLPSSQAVVLNRVGSTMPSKIEGLLSSNGVVYLINPNGILITSSGKIDTAGFLASTLNIADQDFLNGGDLLFTGSSGTLINQGTIRCSSGDVILMAYQIKNEQTIEAPKGITALGTGQEILMTLQGDERLTVRLSTPESKEEIGIHQTGNIEAMKAELKADGNLYAYAIKNEGTINAISSVEQAGRIYLVAEKGTVTSSGKLVTPSGEVRLLGQTVSLTGDAVIDVSGENGQGTILVGGDYRGKNPDILNAEVTSVESGVKINADALAQGNGGKVIFWADNATSFHGNISAQGGPQGGDGGFVEVSGKYLDYQGMTNTRAPLGKTGMLLLDPVTLTISTGADTGVFSGCGSPPGTYTYTVPTSNINAANLENNLINCAVIIDTFNGAVGSGTGTITITGDAMGQLTLAGNTLTLNADTTTVGSTAAIIINANIINSSGGNFICNAANNISFGAGFGYSQTGSGSATFAASQVSPFTSSFSTTATSPISNTGTGSITISAANAVASNAILIAGSISLSSGAGSFSASTTTGDILITGNITSAATTPFMVETTGSNGTITITGGTTGIDFSAAGAQVTIQTIASTGNIVLAGATSPMSFGSTSPTAFLTINSGAGITLDGMLTYASQGACQFTAAGNITNNLNGIMNFNSGCGPVTFKSTAGNISFNATPTITFNPSAGNAQFVTMSPSGLNITMGPFVYNAGSGSTAMFNSNGGLTLNGTFLYEGSPASGTCTMIAAGGIISEVGATITFNTSSLSMSSPAGGITTNDAITFGASAGSLSMSSTTGEIAISGGMSYSSTQPFTMTSTTGELLMNGPAITFNAGAGSLTMTSPGGIAISNDLTNNGPGAFILDTRSGSGGIGVEASGLITFANTAASLTMESASGGVSIGSAVNYSSSGLFAISSTTGTISTTGLLTIAATAGSVSMTSTTGTIVLSGGMNYSSANPFTMTSTTGALLVNGVAVTFSPGAGSLTLMTGGLIETSNTITNNGPGAFIFNSTGAVGILMEFPGLITVTTAAPLSFSAPLAAVTLEIPVTNTSTGLISVTSPTLNINALKGVAQLGSLGGNLTLNVSNVSVLGGSAIGDYAQIGYNQGPVNSNITFANCNSVTVQGGTANDCYAIIGHGSPSNTNGMLTGNINFGTPLAAGGVIIGGNPLPSASTFGTNCFMQIGHTRSTVTAITAVGDITLSTMGNMTLSGGNNSNTYALIGHGGAVGSAGDSYTGDVIVNATGNISLATALNPNAANAFAAIGPSSINTVAGTTTINGGTTNTVTAMATGNITLDPEANNECIIGSYIKSTGGGTGTIDFDTINVQAGGSLTMTSLSPPGTSVNGALIGALSYTGVVGTAPHFTAAGTATSTLSVTVGNDLLMETSFGGANTSTFTAIQNGLGGAIAPTSVTVTGTISLLGGNNLSTIYSLGALTVNGTGSVTLLSDQTTGSFGNASILGHGTTAVTGGAFNLTGFIGGPAASIQTTAGNLTVSASGSMAISSSASINLTAGAGVLGVNATGDLMLSNTALITSLASGGTSMVVGGMTSLTAGFGNASIVNTAGPFSLAITDNNLNLITNAGGQAFITSGGAMTITATNMSLGGIGTTGSMNSYILGTAGDMLLIALNNIALDDNASITSTAPLGTGDLTIVVDEQAPVSPQIGPGRFILAPNATVMTVTGNNLHVFTGRPNSISAGNLAFGDLNATPAFVTVCPFDRPPQSALNQYSTYYLAYTAQFGDPVYTIFYKEPAIPIPPGPGPSPFVPSAILAALERGLARLAWGASEVFWFMREYPRYDMDKVEFLVCNKPLKKRYHNLYPEPSYPLVHQNWTLYPIEFKRDAKCSELQ